MNLDHHKNSIQENGFTVINNVFSEEEIKKIGEIIQNIDTSKETFRKSDDLFAIRQFLKEIPQVRELVFNENIKNIITEIFGEKYFVVKTIYFDKPEKSNGMWHIIRILRFLLTKKQIFRDLVRGPRSRISLPFSRRLTFWKIFLLLEFTWMIPMNTTVH